MVEIVRGGERSRLPVATCPFTIGRKSDRDLVLSDPRISREHAQISLEGTEYVLRDLGSKHGTFVNGVRVDQHVLQSNDRVDFGASDYAYLIFDPREDRSGSNAREFLSQISAVEVRSGASDLEKMRIFLEAARRLNTTGVLEEVLVTLIEATLRLTRAERGYVFLRLPDGSLRLAAGRNSRGEPLLDDKGISHSILEEAANAASEFLVTDTSQSAELAARNSIVAYDLRTVICIPLRRMQVHQSREEREAAAELNIGGVLYLDSRFASREFSAVSHDLLRAIATEAAALVENAHLAQAEAAARQYQQELAIAASIQQRLMAVTIPEVPYASIYGRNLSCREIGGDFFDVVQTADGLAVVLTDVSGKGVSAALLGSILQGMIYSQLISGGELKDIATNVNRFLCQKVLGEKYATVIIARLKPNGELELINCGHVPPVLVQGRKVSRLTESNLPVGLIQFAEYDSLRCRLNPGDRLLLVTDGVTEAEDAAGEMFGNERLEQAALSAEAFDQILADVRSFCGAVPLSDDCTIVELTYKG
jgi:serine phosphatase RsbU (regulator of sigma subunit)